MQIQPTDWFPLSQHAPVREGWYEVRLTSEDTAYAKFIAGEWTEKPVLVFTHWRGLRTDPAKSGETPPIDAAATAAQGVRAAWDAFFPRGGVHQDD
jgi:hypothetical protein